MGISIREFMRHITPIVTQAALQTHVMGFRRIGPHELTHTN